MNKLFLAAATAIALTAATGSIACPKGTAIEKCPSYVDRARLTKIMERNLQLDPAEEASPGVRPYNISARHGKGNCPEEARAIAVDKDRMPVWSCNKWLRARWDANDALDKALANANAAANSK